jgi:hypothetical protein
MVFFKQCMKNGAVKKTATSERRRAGIISDEADALILVCYLSERLLFLRTEFLKTAALSR